jgi:hypothetical protein
VERDGGTELIATRHETTHFAYGNSRHPMDLSSFLNRNWATSPTEELKNLLASGIA